MIRDKENGDTFVISGMKYTASGLGTSMKCSIDGKTVIHFIIRVAVNIITFYYVLEIQFFMVAQQI